ncbi:transglutaminase family protein [Erythrobacter sp. BLCC-B19]|uniref:transglutaminase family protein n=1 Tax=Erythrobacter sp. BLCC-B19 TaxID=3025315 RepID=UPI0023612D1B|nr:transglutaminase family protein [Erythrobacter sp. BLCC-B19]WDA41210.1 transglutaminase family protein [Erythrobacter sp. BLCC-B19]
MSKLTLSIRHTTHYAFAEPVVHALQRLRLTPKETQGQRIGQWSMVLDNARAELEYDDQHFNHVTLISLTPGAREVTVTCEGVVETEDNAGVIGRHSGHLPLWSFLRQTPLTRPGAKLRALLREAAGPADSAPLDFLHSLSALIRERITYETGRTHAATTAEEAVGHGFGVCQDHAHIFIGAARASGIPARYVSGYLLMHDRIDQEATHAWAEAHVEGLGWVGFDVSNGICPDPGYVRVATGSDYRDAAPVTGISIGAFEEALTVGVAVAVQNPASQTQSQQQQSSQ